MELSTIQSRIYEIRGVRVMPDFDLAAIYGVETKRLKEQVRRNIERFPHDFMFQLAKSEWSELVAICDQLPETIKHSYILPMAFTQEGIAMLSGVLCSALAVQVNIGIMRALVSVRRSILTPPVSRLLELEKQVQELKQYMNDVFTNHNDINEDTRMQLELLREMMVELQVQNRGVPKNRRIIGFRYDERQGE